MLNNIKVIKSGACTTIQDLGRVGYQKFGIPVAGVMDEFSASVANFLVGNKREEAVLEITYIGPQLEFQESMTFAIAGAELSPKLNGEAISTWESYQVQAGDILSFGAVRAGVRAYLAFAGSIDVPLVNGSKSTLMKSKIGGFQGRMLQNGDILSVISRKEEKKRRLATKYRPDYAHSQKIHVCLGPQDDYFTEEGIASFLSQTYTISANADRMGIRLEGEAIAHKEKADIISDAAVIGSIQVPADGKPIILMADRQTTGGYTKIATVIKEDIVKLAQMGPKDSLDFVKLSLEEAQERYKAFYHRLAEIQESLEQETKAQEREIIDSIIPMLLEGDGSMRKFKVSIDGISHVVEVEELTEGLGSLAAAPKLAGAAPSSAIKEKASVPIGGTLSDLRVKVGDKVQEGDLLFIFEAMKMENEVLASCSGTILIIHKKVGELLDAEEVVLEIGE